MIYNDCRDCAKYDGDCGKHHKDSHGHVDYRIPNMCYTARTGPSYCTAFQPSKNMYKAKCHMTIKEIISQLESLRADAMERIDPEDEDDVFKKDVEALDKAIVVLQFGVYARGESE